MPVSEEYVKDRQLGALLFSKIFSDVFMGILNRKQK